MQTPQDVYIPNEIYNDLRTELTRLVSQSNVHDAETKVVEALGEIAGIWPKSILSDVLIA